jgi:rhodanese-related sulfurtransferase
MLVISFLLFSVLSYMMYYRYFPVRTKQWSSLELTSRHVVVDVRDYQDSSKGDCDNIIAIPCGYIRRHSRDIPDGSIVVLGSNPIECNVGVRQLKRLGFPVEGFIIIDSDKKCNEYLSLG